MSLARALCLLAVLPLLIPHGIGHIDLCVCRAGHHGWFCAGPAPQPRPMSPCCAQEHHRASHPNHRGPCPDCPSLDLPQKLPIAAPGDGGPTVPLDLSAGVTHSWPSPPDAASRVALGPVGWPRPPPSRHRLHLLHSVFLL